MAAKSTWANPELVRRLRELWDAGRSGSDIANTLSKEFKLKLSRNSVIGAAHRLRLKLRGTPHKQITTEEGKRAHRERKERSAFKVSHYAMSPGRLYPQPTPYLIPINGGIPILSLKSSHCRAVIGRDEGAAGLARFCGAERVPGKAWCQHHLEKFTTKAGPVHGHFVIRDYPTRQDGKRAFTPSS